MILANNFKRGIVIKLNSELFEILDVSYVKPGKGGAFARTKIKNIKSGAITDRMFRAEEKVPKADITTISVEYLYKLDNLCHFMDFTANEEYILTLEQLSEKNNFLIENQTVKAMIYNGSLIDIELPASVILEIKHTEPGIKGSRVSGATKDAIVETGYKTQVPLFVKTGDKIKIDTRTGKYINRA